MSYFWRTICSWPVTFRRLLKFFPTICNDRDFDYYGLYGYIKTKLELLEPSLRYGHLANGVKYADEIKVVLEKLNKIIEDDYDEEELSKVEKKWGKPAFNFVPYEDGSSQLIDRRELNLSVEEKEQMRKEIRESFKEAERKRVSDITFVFDTLKDNHRYWWD